MGRKGCGPLSLSLSLAYVSVSPSLSLASLFLSFSISGEKLGSVALPGSWFLGQSPLFREPRDAAGFILMETALVSLFLARYYTCTHTCRNGTMESIGRTLPPSSFIAVNEGEIDR